MKRKLYNIAYLFLLLFAISCEDLEDTYDAGDGTIRYVGKCSDLNVLAGWKRLLVTWNGNLDATIDSVKITWKSELDAVPHVYYKKTKNILDCEDLRDSLWVEGLSDAVYTVTVSNLSKEGKESIVEQTYARPYTESHENLRAFSRGIINFYILENKLAIILDENNSDMIEVVLCYWGTDNQEHQWDIKKNMNRKLYYRPLNIRDYFFLLPEENGVGIDFTKPLTIKRKGKLTDCIDVIEFDDLELSLEEEVWSAEFSRLLKKNYGNNWKERINEVETIELDYNFSSFQDLCYFPNLKKVILGKNRYMQDGSIEASTTDFYKGLVTLQFLKDTRGVSVERYNEHYFGKMNNRSYIDLMVGAKKIKAGLIEEKGNTNVIPTITPLDTTGWKVTCSDTLYNGYKPNGVAYLLTENCDDPEECFSPGLTSGATIFEVKFDMKKPTLLKGFKVMQPTSLTKLKKEYLLASLKIEVSVDGHDWKNATYEDGGIFIGTAMGETTLIKIPEALQQEVQYIRLTMSNQKVGEMSDGTALFSLSLGAFIPF